MKPLRYNINAKDESAEIYIYDEIGASPWGDGVTPKAVAEALKEFKGVKRIDVRINSPGGSVFDGQAIYSLFNEAKAKIVMKIDGLAASAASFIAMAGDEIEMAQGADMMIHDAWGVEAGSAADLRKTADLLDVLSGQIADAYQARTGLPMAQVRAMMQAETWMTAQEAVEKGFATSMTENKSLAACFNRDHFLKYWKATPARILAQPVQPDYEEELREKIKQQRLTLDDFKKRAMSV